MLPTYTHHFYKTKTCPWYFKGKCERGLLCRFAHNHTEKRSLPDLSYTSLCPVYTEKGLCNDLNCRYAHGLDQLRSTNNLYKTSLCYMFMKNNCQAGTNCRHAHGIHELRQVAANPTAFETKGLQDMSVNLHQINDIKFHKNANNRMNGTNKKIYYYNNSRKQDNSVQNFLEKNTKKQTQKFVGTDVTKFGNKQESYLSTNFTSSTASMKKLCKKLNQLSLERELRSQSDTTTATAATTELAVQTSAQLQQDNESFIYRQASDEISLINPDQLFTSSTKNGLYYDRDPNKVNVFTYREQCNLKANTPCFDNTSAILHVSSKDFEPATFSANNQSTAYIDKSLFSKFEQISSSVTKSSQQPTNEINEKPYSKQSSTSDQYILNKHNDQDNQQYMFNRLLSNTAFESKPVVDPNYSMSTEDINNEQSLLLEYQNIAERDDGDCCYSIFKEFFSKKHMSTPTDSTQNSVNTSYKSTQNVVLPNNFGNNYLSDIDTILQPKEEPLNRSNQSPNIFSDSIDLDSPLPKICIDNEEVLFSLDNDLKYTETEALSTATTTPNYNKNGIDSFNQTNTLLDFLIHDSLLAKYNAQNVSQNKTHSALFSPNKNFHYQFIE